jgi:hypothetical protein
LTNIYVEEIHIDSVRSSCGCTTPSIKTPWLKTYQQGAIVAKFNTDVFRGQRGATITVTIDKPYYAEVQLHVRGYIRSDVVFNPGSVPFGTVDQGQPRQQRVALAYAGRSDWKITGLKSSNPHITGQVRETGRSYSQVNYELAVQLDGNAPPGYLNDRLVLVTNDYRKQEIPLVVEGMVSSGLTVSPGSLMIGVVEPGKKVTKQLVVQGKKPFRILSIHCDDPAFEFDTSKANMPKTVHVIPVTFAAGDHAGKISKTIRIETDLGGSAANPQLPAYASVAGR